MEGGRLFIGYRSLRWESCSCDPRVGAMQYTSLCQDLWFILVLQSNQAGGLQGSHSGNCDTLAANDLGIGSGWQQSKQN